MINLTILKQFTIAAKEKGRYHSFPTLIRQQERLWLACRSGSVSSSQPHGVAGEVWLYSADTATPDKWTPHGKLFGPSAQGTFNELDAILSAPKPDLIFLATRDFQKQHRNDVYLAQGPTPILAQRTRLTEISDQFAICFGHIRSAVNGDLLMPGYCGFEDEPVGAPVLLFSTDTGKTWSLRAKVASSTKAGTRLTEYSLGHLGHTNWTTLIRSETPPFYLHQCESSDDGKTWSDPKKTQLCGHAPMILDLPPDSQFGRGHLVIYRDLVEPNPGVSVGVSLDNGADWQRAGRLVDYQGSIYDGGYGDLIQLEDNLYLAVYYICDKDDSPWIEASLFHF